MSKESFEGVLVVACIMAALGAICFWVNSCSVTERKTWKPAGD